MAGANAAVTQAAPAFNLGNDIGVNTHIDFTFVAPYNNLSTVINAVKYLGVVNLRDSPAVASDVGANGRWQQVASATGAKFDAFMPEGSVAAMEGSLPFAQQLAGQGILNFIESGDEEDSPYAISYGNNLQYAAAFQREVYAAGHALGLPVVNMSFGQGWTAANDWHGDYDKVGDLSAYCDYANAHTYPSAQPLPTILLLNGDAKIAASQRPVMTTELGYDTSTIDETTAAKYTLDAIMDGFANGNAKTYIYALFDDQSGKFGLMNADGSPKPAGAAVHNLMAIAADTHASFTPGSLGYTISGAPSTLNSYLFQRTDGTFILAIWNEVPPSNPVQVLLSLTNQAASVNIYDPMIGTAVQSSSQNISGLTINVPDHPILVFIKEAPATPVANPTPTPTPTSTSTPTPAPTPASTPTTTATTTTTPAPVKPVTVDVPSVLFPATPTVAAQTTTAIKGVSIVDAWAQQTPGAMALNISVSQGSIRTGSQGTAATAFFMQGTLALLNAALASLQYTAPANAGTAILTLNPWNQAGNNSTKSLPITVVAPAK